MVRERVFTLDEHSKYGEYDHLQKKEDVLLKAGLTGRSLLQGAEEKKWSFRAIYEKRGDLCGRGNPFWKNGFEKGGYRPKARCFGKVGCEQSRGASRTT